MFTRTRLTSTLIAVGLAAVCATAAAAVIFDFATGKGFVGKGDVQTAFTWNNAQLQRNAAGVSFNVTSIENYSAVCTWTTGDGTPGEHTHTITIPRHTSVNSEIAYDARVRTQITGFILKGYGATTTEGSVPVVGGVCPGQGTDGTWTDVILTGYAGGGLYVSYGGTSVLLAERTN